MSNEDLARRAVASPHWRWIPGMLAIHPNWREYRVSHVGLTGMHGACRYASPMGGVERAVVALPLPTSSDVLPDLTDPATVGCLLALVREAYDDRDAFVGRYAGYWTFETLDPMAPRVTAPTEAHCLVAALEAAP